jgi:hypothetical protein
MKVWVVLGMTESGDSIGPAVFDYPITKDELHTEARKTMPQEYEDGLTICFDIWEEEVNTKDTK